MVEIENEKESYKVDFLAAATPISFSPNVNSKQKAIEIIIGHWTDWTDRETEIAVRAESNRKVEIILKFRWERFLSNNKMAKAISKKEEEREMQERKSKI